MELLTFVGLAAIAWWIWASVQRKKAEDLAEEMWELRFPTLDEYSTYAEGDTYRSETFADLKEMLLVVESSDYDYRRSEVYHLRRSDGPLWEAKEELASWKKSIADAEEQYRLIGALAKERLEKLKAGPQWEPIPNEGTGAKLEVAYQRFVSRFRDIYWPKSRVQVALEQEYRRGQKKTA